MKVYKAETSESANKLLLAQKNRRYFDTSFHHLKEHNGLRPGKMHIAIGTTSAGKSTWVLGVVVDFVRNNSKSKILLYLSEESFEDFRLCLYTCSLTDQQIGRIMIVSELSNDSYRDSNQFISNLEAVITEHKPDLFIFDNLTTSKYYNDLKTKDQEIVATRIKKITMETKIATLVIAHTKKDINVEQKRLIQIEDIRGSSTLPNLMEFAYVIQHFFMGENRYTFIRIVKSRGYTIQNTVFALIYDREKQIIRQDNPISFQTLKLNFKEKNQL